MALRTSPTSTPVYKVYNQEEVKAMEQFSCKWKLVYGSKTKLLFLDIDIPENR
jgi:hypothetical protein